MIDKYVLVSGVRVKLKPYTEKRLKELLEIQAKIDDFIDKNPDLTFDELDRDIVAGWWKEKADILWESTTNLSKDFFASEDFESSVLRDTETLFLTNRQYL
jgi:hypothetical protein